jgi:LmbE family N-acetylglucosaminyl deacetylase
MFDPKRILVLAPHTDDGELGCGGSVAKFRAEGREVFYAAFSLCSKSLQHGLAADTLAQECREATSQLGIESNNISLFDFEVRDFPKFRQEILEELVKLGKKINPDLVIIPSSTDIHQDHGVIHTEGLRAFKNCSLLGYELPWNHAQFQSTFFIPLAEDNVKQKVRALKAYRSQAHRNYMDEDFIFSLAKVRGVQSNTAYAEAFEVYRMISDQ